jgi:hypothetical protein
MGLVLLGTLKLGQMLGNKRTRVGGAMEKQQRRKSLKELFDSVRLHVQVGSHSWILHVETAALSIPCAGHFTVLDFKKEELVASPLHALEASLAEW